VHALAQRLRKANVEVTCEGTEAVYVRTLKNVYELLDVLDRRSYGPKDVQVVEQHQLA
jgi:hypothetical protein